MLRKGKIARLPRSLRDELNCRLAHNEDGGVLLDWLNAAPDVQAMLARDFAGEPISKQNLHEWRNGGLLEWQARLDLLEQARDLAADAGQSDPATCGKLTENMATMLVVRHAALLARWDGGDNETIRTQLRILHSLTRDLVALRRIILNPSRPKNEPAPGHRNEIETTSTVTAESIRNAEHGCGYNDLLVKRPQPPATVPKTTVAVARANAAVKNAAEQIVAHNSLSSRTDRLGSDLGKERPTPGAVGSSQVKPTPPKFGAPHPALDPSAVPVVTALGSAVDQFVAACAPSPQTGFLPSALRREIFEVLTKNQK
jgi:hypothetical protein